MHAAEAIHACPHLLPRSRGAFEPYRDDLSLGRRHLHGLLGPLDAGPRKWFGLAAHVVHEVAIAPVGKAQIAWQPIRHDQTLRNYRLFDKRPQAFGGRIANPPHSNPTDQSPPSLRRDGHKGFLPYVAASSPCLHTADERLVNLDLARELVSSWPDHGPAQLVCSPVQAVQ